MQDPAFRSGLVSALAALVALQKVENSSDGSRQGMIAMLGACMELVVERRALKARDSLFFKCCLQCLKKCLEAFDLSET